MSIPILSQEVHTYFTCTLIPWWNLARKKNFFVAVTPEKKIIQLFFSILEIEFLQIKKKNLNQVTVLASMKKKPRKEN